MDRTEHVHPLMVAPLLEVPREEETATDGSIARQFDSPPSWAEHCDKREQLWAIAGHAQA